MLVSVWEVFGIYFKKTHLIDLILQAHIAGHAGKNIQRGRIDTIVALDAAGPRFSSRSAKERLDFTDAAYVEVIHTNTRISGFKLPIGDSDFYPNGGATQPGCWTSFCHHDRAPLFFIESINSNHFNSYRCGSFSDVSRGCYGTLVTMGGEPSNARRNVSGIFRLTTNRSSPYAQGGPSVSNLP